MLPKKTVLKVTPNLPAAKVKPAKPKRNEYLRECFQTIIDRELLHMNAKIVHDILINDLRINLKSLPYRLQCVLGECLCHYMKIWPGWSKYTAQSRTDKLKREYFEKFRQYLNFKMNYIIKNENTFWNDPPAEAYKDDNKVSKEVQTEPVSKSQKPEAPYNLVISGQPNVLNNIVFIEVDNNILIKQHAEKPWKALTIPEFLNYSFVYAEVTLPDIHLSRSNLHEFQRYITECGDTATCPDVDFITYVRKTNRSVESKVYTFNFISAYFMQFLEVIRQVPGINNVRVTELEEIFKEFLKDIQATNLHGQTMATSTSVCFNIGGSKYIRNKKMVVNNHSKKDTNAINFCEILIPRTSYTLHEFTAEEDPSTEYASFKSLNEILCLIKKGKASDFYPIIESINNCVSYQCILCPKTYQGEHAYVEMLDHFRFLHKGEQSVLCFKCRRQFEIPKLSGKRWGHKCDPQAFNNLTGAGITDAVGTVFVSAPSALSTGTTSGIIPHNIPNSCVGIPVGIPAPINTVGPILNTHSNSIRTSVGAPVSTIIAIPLNTHTSTLGTSRSLVRIPGNAAVTVISKTDAGNDPVSAVTCISTNTIDSVVSTTINGSANGMHSNNVGNTRSTPISACADLLSGSLFSDSLSVVDSTPDFVGNTLPAILNTAEQVSDVTLAPTTAYDVAPAITATSGDLFSDFGVDSMSASIADLNSAPAPNLITSTSSAMDTEATTAINIASIMEHISF